MCVLAAATQPQRGTGSARVCVTEKHVKSEETHPRTDPPQRQQLGNHSTRALHSGRGSYLIWRVATIK